MRLIFIALLLVGCTITPRIVRSPVASFDQGAQNSGFLGFARDGSGILTAHARDRYNALIQKHGSRFLVPIKPDEGLTVGPQPGTWLIDQQHLVKFQIMNRWEKSK